MRELELALMRRHFYAAALRHEWLQCRAYYGSTIRIEVPV